MTGTMTAGPELTIYSDGASRNNPGEAGAGVYIMQDGEDPGEG